VAGERDRSDRSRAAISLDSPVGNYNKTIGIIGASLIGRRVIDLVSRFDHLDIVVYDPFLAEDDAEAIGVRNVDLLELCACSDVVSIHAPALSTTHHMIDESALAVMRDGTTLINTVRGSLVDHDALLAHLRRGRLSALLDVTDPEPLPADHPLRALPNVLVTPHLAGSQGSELIRLADWAIEEIERWAADEPARHEVTKAQLGHIA
jgi:phosphoglycerate dehydrogenase-like enzyme